MAVATRVEPITGAVHLSIDMQNIFAPGGVWATPWMERVLPLIVEITARYPARTVPSRSNSSRRRNCRSCGQRVPEAADKKIFRRTLKSNGDFLNFFYRWEAGGCPSGPG